MNFHPFSYGRFRDGQIIRGLTCICNSVTHYYQILSQLKKIPGPLITCLKIRLLNIVCKMIGTALNFVNLRVVTYLHKRRQELTGLLFSVINLSLAHL